MQTIIPLVAVIVVSIALLILVVGEAFFLGLPQIKRLQQLKTRLEEVELDGKKFEEAFKADGPYIKLRPFFMLQILPLARTHLTDDDGFRIVADIANVVGIRPRAHRRLLRELRATCAGICLVFLVGLAWGAKETDFRSVSDALSAMSPLTVTIKTLTLGFLLYRFAQEYRDVRELNDAPGG